MTLFTQVTEKNQFPDFIVGDGNRIHCTSYTPFARGNHDEIIGTVQPGIVNSIQRFFQRLFGNIIEIKVDWQVIALDRDSVERYLSNVNPQAKLGGYTQVVDAFREQLNSLKREGKINKSIGDTPVEVRYKWRGSTSATDKKVQRVGQQHIPSPRPSPPPSPKPPHSHPVDFGGEGSSGSKPNQGPHIGSRPSSPSSRPPLEQDVEGEEEGAGSLTVNYPPNIAHQPVQPVLQQVQKPLSIPQRSSLINEGIEGHMEDGDVAYDLSLFTKNQASNPMNIDAYGKKNASILSEIAYGIYNPKGNDEILKQINLITTPDNFNKLSFVEQFSVYDALCCENCFAKNNRSYKLQPQGSGKYVLRVNHEKEKEYDKEQKRLLNDIKSNFNRATPNKTGNTMKIREREQLIGYIKQEAAKNAKFKDIDVSTPHTKDEIYGKEAYKFYQNVIFTLDIPTDGPLAAYKDRPLQ